MLKPVIGGNVKDNAHLQTIVQPIMNDPRLGSLCQSGWHCTNLSVESGESSHDRLLNLQLQRSDEEIAIMSLGLIHVRKSFYAQINSVTLRKLSPESGRMKIAWKGKCVLPLSLELSNLVLQTSLTYEKSGKRTPKMSGYLAYPLLESSTVPSSTTSTMVVWHCD